MGEVSEDVSGEIATIQQHPGLFAALGTSESLMQIKSFVATPGIQETELARELLAFIPGDGALLSGGWRELAQRLRNWLLGVKVEVVNEAEIWLPFRVHALWCPSVDGAEASLKISNEESEVGSCRIEVSGIGGGPEFSLSFKVADSFTTTAASVAVTYDFLTVWQYCRVESKSLVTFFPRMHNVLRKSRRVRTTPLAPTSPPAEWGNVIDDVHIDLAAAPTKLTRSLEIAAGTKWEASSTIDAFGVKVGPKYAATMKQTTIAEYKLPPGHRYRAQQFEHAPWWWWYVE